MKNKITLLLCAILMPCALISSEPNLSVEEVFGKFQAFAESPELCSSAECTLQLQINDGYDRNSFGIFLTHCYDAVVSLQKCEQVDGEVVRPILGASFSQLFDLIKSRDGMHGGIGVSLKDDAVSFTCRFYHADDYDVEAWRNTLSQFVAFVQIFVTEGFVCDTPLLSSVCMLENVQGISRSVSLRMVDSDENAYWITNTRDA